MHCGPGAWVCLITPGKPDRVCARTQDEVGPFFGKIQIAFSDAAKRGDQGVVEINRVIPVAGVERDDCVGTIVVDPVVPGAADDKRMAFLIEIIVANATIHEVVTDVPLLDVVIAGTTAQDVVARVALEIVIPAAPGQNVVASSAEQLVVAVTAIQEIVARAALEFVVACVSKECVFAGKTIDDVISIEAVERVGTFGLAAYVVECGGRNWADARQ